MIRYSMGTSALVAVLALLALLAAITAVECHFKRTQYHEQVSRPN